MIWDTNTDKQVDAIYDTNSRGCYNPIYLNVSPVHGASFETWNHENGTPGDVYNGRRLMLFPRQVEWLLEDDAEEFIEENAQLISDLIDSYELAESFKGKWDQDLESQLQDKLDCLINNTDRYIFIDSLEDLED